MAEDGSRRRHTAYEYISGHLDDVRPVSERISHESLATDHVLSVVCVATTR